LIEDKNLVREWNKYKNQKNDINKKCALFYEDKNKHYKEKKYCKDCKELTGYEQEKFNLNFKNHIIKSLYKLKENN